MSGSRNSAGKSEKKDQASQADRHRLYELSVQYAPSEIEFVDDTFKSLRGRRARLLREDFCGTANVSCEWIRQRNGNYAIGVDIDREVLLLRHFEELSNKEAAAVLGIQENAASNRYVRALGRLKGLLSELADG